MLLVESDGRSFSQLLKSVKTKLTGKWEKERAEIEAIKKTKEELEKARIELDQAQVRLVQWTQCDMFSNTC
jgi:ATP-dependent Clp protease ATP-binding subunit ClpB